MSGAQARGIEMALTPAVFAGLGWLVDRAVGTAPAFLIAFVIFSVVGMFVRTWIGYDADMRKHEAGQAWTRDGGGPT